MKTVWDGEIYKSIEYNITKIYHHAFNCRAEFLYTIRSVIGQFFYSDD